MMSMSMSMSIPRPLVRTNQWVIVLSVALAWGLQQTWILAVPLVCGLCGLLFDFNPVMKLGRLFLKKPMGAYVPEDKGQQKFNQVIAVACLLLAIISWAFGWEIAMYVFSSLVLLAAFVAILGFCVGCFIRYQWGQYRYRRSMSKSR